jgi:hypothetical protein
MLTHNGIGWFGQPRRPVTTMGGRHRWRWSDVAEQMRRQRQVDDHLMIFSGRYAGSLASKSSTSPDAEPRRRVCTPQ